MRRGRGAILLVGLVLAGCSLPDDMSQSPAISPYEQPRMPPEGTLGIGDPPILSRATAWTTLANPRPATDEVLEEGAELYRIYCAVCHGLDGAGEGPVAEYFQRVPDLGSPLLRRYQDGRLYTIIRQGGFGMPAYADSLSVDERWAVVRYLQVLGDGR